MVEGFSSSDIINQQSTSSSSVVRSGYGPKLKQLIKGTHAGPTISIYLKASWPAVSQICSLICLLSIVIMRAPNSTPIVKSWTGWNLLSVNCRRRQDFPTPANPIIYLSLNNKLNMISHTLITVEIEKLVELISTRKLIFSSWAGKE